MDDIKRKLLEMEEKLDAILAILTKATRNRKSDFASPDDDETRTALLRHMAGAKGLMTATQIAQRCGLDTQMHTLMSIGRVLDSMGVRRVRRNHGRLFDFG